MQSLYDQIQELKKEVEELKTKSVTDVFVQTLEGFSERLTRVENEVKGIGTALGIVAEGKAGN